MLPDASTLDRVMRYEAHVSRQLLQTLHTLERLQAARAGEPVPPPAALDVTVNAPALPGGPRPRCLIGFVRQFWRPGSLPFAPRWPTPGSRATRWSSTCSIRWRISRCSRYQKHEDVYADLPRVTQAEAIAQAASVVERMHRLYLKSLRALQDLRRSPPVVVRRAGQVNIAHQQVNVTE
jgi:hypothetical protein